MHTNVYSFSLYKSSYPPICACHVLWIKTYSHARCLELRSTANLGTAMTCRALQVPRLFSELYITANSLQLLFHSKLVEGTKKKEESLKHGDLAFGKSTVPGHTFKAPVRSPALLFPPFQTQPPPRRHFLFQLLRGTSLSLSLSLSLFGESSLLLFITQLETRFLFSYARATSRKRRRPQRGPQWKQQKTRPRRQRRG